MVAICSPSCITSDTMALCTGCDQTFSRKFYKQDDTAIEFLQNHIVLPNIKVIHVKKEHLQQVTIQVCATDKTNPKNKNEEM